MLVSINHGETGTVIYFKGCSLQCPWCLHPEFISPDLEIVCNRENCIACRECVYGCPQEAISLNENSLYRKTNSCNLCLNCVEICPSLVFSTVGERQSCKQVMEQIETQLPLHSQTASQVLFTGGEPLLQPDTLIHLLDECGKFPLHRVVSTSGSVPTSVLLQVAKRTDMFLYTIRHMDSDVHQQMTGQPNELPLHNLRELSATGAGVQIRLLLIKNVNDSEENIKATGAFLTELGNRNAIQLLSLDDIQHQTVRHKTGLSLRIQHLIPDEKSILEVKSILEAYGLQITSKVK
ncbi:glycyl-radical enzyme activating protein [Desulfopila sp. IMCC35008]|uniref:glycyl-radical enzyme activating protein n=1 Tax=Desulfopila sp. IMCC35008 TaxID=2653858 RepID=UPI001F0D7D78|nr:glycyl-radical enzyme activating protein [Desulfopila sp. IMCC35008]